MIDYIKFLILAIFSGIIAPLPLSSSAQFSFMNSVLNFSQDGKTLGFYYSVFMIMFSVAIFFRLRKIYLSIFKSCLKKEKNANTRAYKKRLKNILLSVLPSAVLFIPVDENTLLCDYADRLLTPDSLFVVSVASILCGLYIVVSIWYTRQRNGKRKRATETKDAMRMSIYNLVAHMIPGLSKVSFSSTNLLICDVDHRVIAREIYLYLGPQLFVYNIVRIIRALISGIVIDPILLAIAVVAVFLCSMLIVSLIAKVNIRKLFAFFSVYSIVFGVVVGVFTFIL